MKKTILFLCAILFVIGMANAASAGLEMLSEGQAQSITDEMVSAFKVGNNKSEQETSNGCANNPMEGNSVSEMIEQPDLPTSDEESYTFASTTSGVSPTSLETGYDPFGRRPEYPGDSSTSTSTIPDITPTTPTTPEPGTLLILGLGLVALSPFARRKRNAIPENLDTAV